MYKIPRGTRDFTSKEMQKRNYLEKKIRNIFKKYGYEEIKTPTFENLELFTAKSGEQIINEIYSFKDKGGRNLALRPELTAPVMRFYVEKLQMEKKPLKLFYFGNCFRYDRPQKGRYREFTQAGCELIGTDKPEALAELIALSYKILQKSGLKNINLNIGNLNILSSFFKKIGLNEDQKGHIIPLIDKSLYGDLYDALQEFGINNKTISEFIDILQTNDLEKIKKLSIKDSIKEFEKLEFIYNLLKNYFKIENFNIKLGIVRGLDYYNGLVFEIEAPVLGAEKQICGGGVYDLIPLFGGRNTPTSGFAIGFDRVLLALENEKFIFPKEDLDIFIVPVNKEMIKKSIELAEKLRENNFLTDIDLLRRGIGKALKYANSKNTKKAVIVGPNELKVEMVTVKDMNSGDQIQIKINNLIEFLKK